MNGGKNVDWTGLSISQLLTVAQLSRDELQVIVCEKNKSRNDIELGRGTVTVRSALSNPGKWVNIRGDLFTGKRSLGQFLIQARFLPEENSNRMPVGDQSIPTAPNDEIEPENMKKLMKMMSSQASFVESKVGGMEGNMQKQLKEVNNSFSSSLSSLSSLVI